MKPIISTRDLTPLCRCCPSDWEAKDHMCRYVYIRFRWGYLRAIVADDSNHTNEQELLAIQHSDPLDGMMDEDEMRRLTSGVIDWVTYPIHFSP